MSFEIGSRVGDYEVTGVLGAGGMGKVYKVRNAISDRVEAMKVLLPDLAENSELEGRFLREIKLLAGLSHPNIAALYTALRIENQLLMVMEFVEGVTVAQRLREGPLPLNLGVDYVCQVLSALSYAHAQGIIHRDIKPANMMVTPAGIVKLMDFGIARTTTDHTLTMTGSTLGSLYYMSPEQIRSEPLDGRADLYSLGVSLYEIATNRRPFRETSDFNIMAAHLQKAPVPPIQVDPSLPPALSEIIMMVMAKDRTQRFQTADAFRNALEGIRSSLGPATVVGPASAGRIRGVVTATLETAPETTATNFGSPAASMPPQTASAALPAARLTPGGMSQSASGNAGVPAGVDGGVLAVPAAAAIPPPLTEKPGPDWLRDPLPPPNPATPVNPNIAADDKDTRRSYRGLYMTAGALVALTVIVVSAIQLPKLRKAKAGTNSISQQTPLQPSAETPGAQPGVSPPPDSSAQSGAAQSGSVQTGSATDTSVQSTSLPANSEESTPTPPGSERTDSALPRTPSAGSTADSGADQTLSPVMRPAEIQHPAKLRKSGPALGRSGQSVQSPPQPASGSRHEIHNTASRGGAIAAAEQQGAPGALAASGSTAPAGTSTPDSAERQEAKELQKQLGLLAARGRTVQSAFEDLQKPQQAQGLSPRLDMTTSLERMKQFLDGAHDALGSGKVDEAKDSMESAEREIAKLEKFLGR